jgi:hypothetical protein
VLLGASVFGALAPPLWHALFSPGTTRSRRCNAVLRELARGPHDLLVMGVSPRAAEQLFFGELATAMLAGAQSSLLFVCAEPDGQLAPRAQA